jgi:undecaprenyl diphosphate synthase
MSTQEKNGLHLAVIPDGNRRWAKEKGFANVWKGHEKAVENFKTLTDWCRKDPRVSALTVWCFSTENWKRDPKEVAELMTMLEKYLDKEEAELRKENVRFIHSGRRDRIPASLRAAIERVENVTKDLDGFTLHLAVDYGGKDEVTRAVNKLIATRYPLPADTTINEEDIRAAFDHPELKDIDIVLRSSGEQRTSNFFLFQSAYAEWVFNPKYFPEIGTADLDEAIKEYEKRKRRFGG